MLVETIFFDFLARRNVIFNKRYSLRVAETDFLANTNHFLIYLSGASASESFFPV